MKVYIGAIAHRNFEAEFVRCLSVMLKQYPNEVSFMPQVGDALVERARSVVATHFLEKTDADVLLTIDSDISFEPKDAMRICEQAMTHDIVAGVYACRSASHPKPSSELYEGPVEFAFDGTPVAVKYAATGFLATHRRVFEKLVQRPDMAMCHEGQTWGFYPFYHTLLVDDDEAGRILLSEDYAFCHYAREEGFQSYINPAVRLGHVGSYTFRLEDMTQRPLEPRPILLNREGSTYRVESVAPLPV